MGTGRDLREAGAVFVNQASRAGLVGPLASWITIAGWAAAAERRYGHAWMATPEGVLDPAAALARATEPARVAASVAGWRRRVPQVVRTAVNDAKRPRANRRFDAALTSGPWDGHDVRFVMQLHGLFCDAGLRAAERLRVPSVLVVDAVQVEEARSWGTHRPGWSRLALRVGEVPQLQRADLVVCVSDEVTESVVRCSGRRTGVVTIPNGVDTDLFSPGDPDAGLRSDLGLDDAFVVGWAGSFRRFHGLETLVDAVAVLATRVPNVRVLLLGDGFGRAAVEERARERGVSLVLPGTVAYTEVPAYLRCMDAAVVLADPGRTFHYSPVKLREYQACGLPVVAAGIGEMARDLHGGVDARLIPPGDAGALADALLQLHDDPAAAAALAAAGRAAVAAAGSWTSRLVEVERLLGIDPPG
ncbi:MAG: glycosyltransferase [Acidimicrobiia bacterium]|jgi:glycosyltransferase involved in cell wall biosynthesis